MAGHPNVGDRHAFRWPNMIDRYIRLLVFPPKLDGLGADLERYRVMRVFDASLDTLRAPHSSG